MKRLFCLFFSLIFFAGCDFGSTPAGVIRKNEMIDLLTDVHIADGYLATSRNDNKKKNREDIYQSIFNRFHTDSIQFKKSLEYYSRNSEEFQVMYQKIEANINDKQEALLKKFETEAEKKK